MNIGNDSDVLTDFKIDFITLGLNVNKIPMSEEYYHTWTCDELKSHTLDYNYNKKTNWFQKPSNLMHHCNCIHHTSIQKSTFTTVLGLSDAIIRKCIEYKTGVGLFEVALKQENVTRTVMKEGVNLF